MNFNPRYFLKIATNATFLLIVFFGLGSILWLIDEVLNWNILPDFIDKYVQVIIAVFGVMGALSILTMLISLLAIVGERIAQKAGYSEVSISEKFKKRVIYGLGIFLLLNVVFFSIDKVRSAHLEKEWKLEQAKEKAKEEAQAAYNYQFASHAIDSALDEHLRELEPILAEYIPNREARNEPLIQLLHSLRRSTPGYPQIEILTCSEAPYKYEVFSVVGVQNDTLLSSRKLLSFPSSDENQMVEEVLEVGYSNVKLTGTKVFFRGQQAHGWRTIQNQGKVIAVLMARSTSIYKSEEVVQ